MDYTSSNYSAPNSASAIDPKDKKANVALLTKYSKMVNIAEELDKDKLYHIGKLVVKEAEADDKTREEWFDKYNEALKIAKQSVEMKTYPFDRASNVKIPLILQGCIQCNARLMPELIQNNKTVNVTAIGTPTGEEEDIAERISDHMSMQTLKIVKNWVTDTDKLMMTLPLVGTVFRKWCYDPIMRKPATYLCLPTEVIVNNDISSISQAQRITHVIRMSRNEIIEKMRYGLFSEIDLVMLKDEQQKSENTSEEEEKVLPSDTTDSNNYYVVYEQCRFLDLDGDGYEEPYIVTVLKTSGDILRIVSRFDVDSFVFNKKGELIKIIPHEYYSAHHFLPSADGTFLGVGFGSILLQLNSAINSITNNLIDAGTLSNIRGGFMSRDLRIQKGDMNFAPGEWKMVNSPMGQAISNSIMPLPISEPSQTLFVLLEYLVNFGRQIANISDVLMGNASQAKDMPATSVVTMVEQGTKIFSSILMRLYESFKQEFEILFDINRRYITLYPEQDIIGVNVEDYTSNKYNVFPVANPALGLNTLKLAKLQMVMQMAAGDPTMNKKEISNRILKAMGISDVDKLWKTEKELKAMSQPSAEELKIHSEIELNKVKASMEQAKAMMAHEADAFRVELQEKIQQTDAAYKGADLAIRQKLADAEIAFKKAQIGPQADILMDKVDADIEQQKVTDDITPDFSDINQQLGLTKEGQQGNMQQSGGEPQQEQGELSPELADQLKQISLEQQQ